MIVTVQVTQDDIDQGIPEDGCLCPIARACRRRFPWLTSLQVGLYDVLSDSLLVELPEGATEFIGDFDDLKPVQPFEFDLDVPDMLILAGAP